MDFLHLYCIGDNHISYDYWQFGKVLFSYLEEVYNSNQMELRDFAKRAYDVWYMLPTHIYENDMFWVLNCADDYLSIGDEKSARELYEKAFSYYKGK